MERYKSFRPTQFDNHITVDNQEEWFVAPVGRNRDSDALSRSNWQSFLTAMDCKENEDTYLIHRFNHWGPGWFEIILINPNNLGLVKKAEEIENALADYPVINDEDFFQEEQMEANETWEKCYSDKDRIKYIRDHYSQFDFHDFSDLLHCARGEYFSGSASELIG